MNIVRQIGTHANAWEPGDIVELNVTDADILTTLIVEDDQTETVTMVNMDTGHIVGFEGVKYFSDVAELTTYLEEWEDKDLFIYIHYSKNDFRLSLENKPKSTELAGPFYNKEKVENPFPFEKPTPFTPRTGLYTLHPLEKRNKPTDWTPSWSVAPEDKPTTTEWNPLEDPLDGFFDGIRKMVAEKANEHFEKSILGDDESDVEQAIRKAKEAKEESAEHLRDFVETQKGHLTALGEAYSVSGITPSVYLWGKDKLEKLGKLERLRGESTDTEPVEAESEDEDKDDSDAKIAMLDVRVTEIQSQLASLREALEDEGKKLEDMYDSLMMPHQDPTPIDEDDSHYEPDEYSDHARVFQVDEDHLVASYCEDEAVLWYIENYVDGYYTFDWDEYRGEVSLNKRIELNDGTGEYCTLGHFLRNEGLGIHLPFLIATTNY